MRLNQLPKIKEKSAKRLGRGYGSGKGGHTVGRGQKGQKVRGKMGPLFEGTKVKKSLIKRLPLGRGKGKLKPKKGTLVINVKYLEVLPQDSVVDRETLVKHGILSSEAREFGVKILGDGPLTKRLTVRMPASAGARKKIVKAGGKVEDAQVN